MAQGYGEQHTYPPTGGHYEQHHEAKGHGTMGAAAGGLAVGAVGGAIVGHALGMTLHLLLILFALMGL